MHIKKNKKPQLPDKFYADNPEIGELQIISKGELPTPEELAAIEPETEKISIVLDKKTLAFFRTRAAELKAPYQRMIRTLLSEYVAQAE